MSSYEDLKNDFLTEEVSTQESTMQQNERQGVNEIDRYDLIDFSLLDDGFSEDPLLNKYELEEENIDDLNIQDLQFTLIPIEEEGSKPVKYMYNELVKIFFENFKWSEKYISKLAHEFFDTEFPNNGLVKKYENEIKNYDRQQVISYKPFVQALLGKENNNNSIENAVTKNWFIPILNETKTLLTHEYDILEAEKKIKPRKKSNDGYNTPSNIGNSEYKNALIVDSTEEDETIASLYIPNEPISFYSFACKSDTPNRYDHIKLTSETKAKMSSSVITYGQLRHEVIKYENSVYSPNNGNVMVSFSRENSLPYSTVNALTNFTDYSKVYDTGSVSFNIRKMTLNVSRITTDPSSSRNNVINEIDNFITPFKNNVVGFFEYNKPNDHKVKIYNLSLDDLPVVKHNKNNIYLFNKVENVQTYAKLLEYIVPNVDDIALKYDGLDIINKKLKKYSYSLDNLDTSIFKTLKNKFTVQPNRKNNFEKLHMTLLNNKLLDLDNTTTLLNEQNTEDLKNYYDNNSSFKNTLMIMSWLNNTIDSGELLFNKEKLRNFNSIKTQYNMKNYQKNIKYFMLKTNNIINEILESTDDEELQKDLIVAHLKVNGVISKHTNSVTDANGLFICCLHTYDKLVNELDIDGLILNYGVFYKSSYVCKYCGETIHVDFDESEMFDDNGNVIVQHGEIMLEEEISIQDDSEANFIKIMNTLLGNVTKEKLNYAVSNEETIKNNSGKMFLKNVEKHSLNNSQLKNIFSVESVEYEINKQSKKIYDNLKNKPANALQEIKTKYSMVYCMSMLFYKIGLYVSVYILNLQLANPKLFDSKDMVTSVTNSFLTKEIITVIGNYYITNSKYVLSGIPDKQYHNFVKKEKVMTVKPFSSSVSIAEMFKTVTQDNYNLLIKDYDNKMLILIALDKIKNENVAVKKHDIKHYGSVYYDGMYDGKRDSIENIMTGIRYTASEHVKNMDTAYRLFKEDNKTEYEQSVLLMVDISSKKDNAARKEFDYETKQLIPMGVPDFKKDLNRKIKENNTINSVSYNIKTLNTNPTISRKKDFVIMKKSKKIITNNVVARSDNCEDSEILSTTIVEFIMKHFLNSMVTNRELLENVDFVKYWYVTQEDMESRLKILLSQSIANISQNKFNEFINEINYADMIKVRLFSEYYEKRKVESIQKELNDKMIFYYENYLKKNIALHSSSYANEKLDILMSDTMFKNYKTIEKNESDNMQCIFLKEIKNNIQTFESIPEKYALVLLKILYHISVDVNLKNKTLTSSEVLLNESQRKKDVNIKDAKSRGENVKDEVKDDYEEDIEEENNNDHNEIVMEYEEENPSGSYQVDDDFVAEEENYYV
jgi:hypothetical protein